MANFNVRDNDDAEVALAASISPELSFVSATVDKEAGVVAAEEETVADDGATAEEDAAAEEDAGAEEGRSEHQVATQGNKSPLAVHKRCRIFEGRSRYLSKICSSRRALDEEEEDVDEDEEGGRTSVRRWKKREQQRRKGRKSPTTESKKFDEEEI